MPRVLDGAASEIAAEAGPEPCSEVDGGTPLPDEGRAKVELIPPPPTSVVGRDHAVEDRTADRELIVSVVNLEGQVIREALIIEGRNDIRERVVADRSASAPWFGARDPAQCQEA